MDPDQVEVLDHARGRHGLGSGPEAVGLLVEEEEAPVPLELPLVARGEHLRGDLDGELVHRGVEGHPLQAGDGRGREGPQVHPQRSGDAEERPHGRVVADGREDGGEEHEGCGRALLLPGQADPVEEAPGVLVGRAGAVHADAAVPDLATQSSLHAQGTATAAGSAPTGIAGGTSGRATRGAARRAARSRTPGRTAYFFFAP